MTQVAFEFEARGHTSRHPDAAMTILDDSENTQLTVSFMPRTHSQRGRVVVRVANTVVASTPFIEVFRRPSMWLLATRSPLHKPDTVWENEALVTELQARYPRGRWECVHVEGLTNNAKMLRCSSWTEAQRLFDLCDMAEVQGAWPQISSTCLTPVSLPTRVIGPEEARILGKVNPWACRIVHLPACGDDPHACCCHDAKGAAASAAAATPAVAISASLASVESQAEVDGADSVDLDSHPHAPYSGEPSTLFAPLDPPVMPVQVMPVTISARGVVYRVGHGEVMFADDAVVDHLMYGTSASAWFSWYGTEKPE